MYLVNGNENKALRPLPSLPLASVILRPQFIYLSIYIKESSIDSELLKVKTPDLLCYAVQTTSSTTYS